MTKFTFNYSDLFQTARGHNKAKMQAFVESFFSAQGVEFDGFELVFFNVYCVGEEDESFYFTVMKDDNTLIDVDFFPNGAFQIREDVNKSGLNGVNPKYVKRASLSACECMRTACEVSENLEVAGEMTLAQAISILGAKSKYTMAHVNKLVNASLFHKLGTLSRARAISLTMQVAEECGGAIAKTLVLELVEIQKAETQAQAEREIERLYEEVHAEFQREVEEVYFKEVLQEVEQELAQEVEQVVEVKPSRAYRKMAIQLSDALFEERVKSANGEFKVGAVKSSIKDIAILIHCLQTGDYAPVYETDMYKKHGGEYCRMLELASTLGFYTIA